ncbi:hypothetical protein BH23GEM6_BH23GEM6_01500 [soil metagenome]
MKLRRASGSLKAVAASLFLLLVGCGDRDSAGASDAIPSPVEWDTGTVQIQTRTETIPVQVEIAETDEQRAYGLMHRTSLPESAGMLFVYDSVQPGEAGFWMFNTRIPLDIAFIDSDGTIVSIRQMEPCTSPSPQWCPSYEAGSPFQYALEMNHGWFERHGVGLGDRVVVGL